MKHDVSTLEQLQAFVEDWSKTLTVAESALLVTLSGDLGAGKTTFTQMLSRELGIESEVTSPTYVIEQRYLTHGHPFKTLVHIDAYRLEQEDDALKIGLDETLKDPSNLVIIEWPEKIQDFLNDYEAITISMRKDGESRELEIQ